MIDDIRIRKLKELKIAYTIANEYDYVPSDDKYNDVVDIVGDFDKSILSEYYGSSPNNIVSEILNIIDEL
jgi:hypothetical protein